MLRYCRPTASNRLILVTTGVFEDFTDVKSSTFIRFQLTFSDESNEGLNCLNFLSVYSIFDWEVYYLSEFGGLEELPDLKKPSIIPKMLLKDVVVDDNFSLDLQAFLGNRSIF